MKLGLILVPTNLNTAYQLVKSDNGSGGVDGMKVYEIVDYLLQHKEEKLTSRANGKYTCRI